MIERKKNLAWLVLARLVIVSLFLVTITLFNFRQPDFFSDDMLRGVTRLIIVSYCFSILTLTSFGLPSKYISAVAYAQILWEIIFASLLVLFTGGIASPYAFFYNLAIINAGLLFARREAIHTASLCGIIYGAIIDFHYFGKLNNFGLYQEVGDYYGKTHLILLILTNLVAFCLTALLTGYLAEKSRSSESALREKEIDYEELKRLNSLIVSNLDSALVTINKSGNIRVFNRAASNITGISSISAYDRPINEILHDIHPLDFLFGNNNRKDIIYKNSNAATQVLSIKSSPLYDKNGNISGAVIDFFDVTKVRELEVKLKKADRLAAIGELSARIAHEIRNPLASISGSVQLISQSGQIPSNDRKLLEIVVRETERLDHLLGDFLNYAKPMPPIKSWFCLKDLIDELIDLLACDKRFAGLKITNHSQADVEIFADNEQMRQIIWNLLLNSAEATPDGGSVEIECHCIEDTNIGPSPHSAMEISVIDSGTGISVENMEMIFEPFFTTKQGGSGLGLAMVHRIIEANNGSITVKNMPAGGTCFKFIIPVEQKSHNIGGMS